MTRVAHPAPDSPPGPPHGDPGGGGPGEGGPGEGDPGGGDPGGGAGSLRRMLNRRFAAAMGAAAALAVANQLLVQPSLLALTGDAPVINVAGRQRMLSQRLSKAALAYRVASDERDRAGRLGELRRTLAAWTRAHEGLRTGDPSLSLPGGNGPAVAAAFDELEPHFAAMRDAARRLSAGEDPGEPVRLILRHEARYLPRMDRIVGLYETEARDRVRTLRRTGWALTGLVLAALAAVGAFVLLPAGRTIGRQVAALRDARRRLEDRVRERTADLETANAALREEHRERLRAEDRQRDLLREYGRASRVNALGEMAAGLAHELNQPLGAVANYVEGCLLRVERGGEDPAALAAALRKARAAALRAAAIVKRVRGFVSRDAGGAVPVAPADLLADVAGLVREDARRRGVRLEVRTAPDLPPVLVDPVQIQQALFNFLTNAFDAVEAAGVPEPRVRLSADAARGRVRFAVEDNGEGVPPELRDRIFDAFHSGRAHGMGMGLAIARTVAEAHHGELAVEAVAGGGARFRLTLPRLPDDSRPGLPAVPRPADPPGPAGPPGPVGPPGADRAPD